MGGELRAADGLSHGPTAIDAKLWRIYDGGDGMAVTAATDARRLKDRRNGK